jgi:hypothetical protein
MTLAQKVATVAVIRDLFPLCGYCGRSIEHAPLAELVIVAGKNRMAHAVCPTSEAT